MIIIGCCCGQHRLHRVTGNSSASKQSRRQRIQQAAMGSFSHRLAVVVGLFTLCCTATCLGVSVGESENFGCVGKLKILESGAKQMFRVAIAGLA